MTTTADVRRAWAVGDVLQLQPGRIRRTDLALFAGGSGDHNPIHLDVDVARAAGMDDVFAQGMLSAAYLARLLTDAVPQAALLSLSTRFVALTPVGAEPTCTATVTAVEDGRASLDLRIVLADGTTTVTGTATVAGTASPSPEGPTS